MHALALSNIALPALSRKAEPSKKSAATAESRRREYARAALVALGLDPLKEAIAAIGRAQDRAVAKAESSTAPMPVGAYLAEFDRAVDVELRRLGIR